MSLIPALGRVKQAGLYEFETSLIYIVKPCLERNREKRKEGRKEGSSVVGNVGRERMIHGTKEQRNANKGWRKDT